MIQWVICPANEGLRALSKRYVINLGTTAKWKCRTSTKALRFPDRKRGSVTG